MVKNFGIKRGRGGFGSSQRGRGGLRRGQQKYY